MKRFLILALFLFPLPSPKASAAESVDRGMRWNAFRISTLDSFESNNGGKSYSAELSWLPTYSLTESASLRLSLGVAPQKSSANSIFITLDGQILAAFQLTETLYADLGGGAQSWTSNGSLYGVGSADLGWKFGAPVFGLIDKAFLGFTEVFATSKVTEVKIGVEVAL